MQRIRTSIRFKLTAAILLPLVVAVVLCWGAGASLVTNRLVALAQQMVERDLISARQILATELDHLADTVQLTSQSRQLPQLLSGQLDPALDQVLRSTLRNSRLSFLTVIDRYGNVCYRAADGASSGGRIERKIVSEIDVALHGRSEALLTLLDATAAAAENPRLPAAMALQIQSTPHARPYPKGEEERGLFLSAASPLRDSAGEVIGAVWAGQLLNGNHELVDRIAQVLFHDEAVGIPAGHATLFLDDVRVATTVRAENGERATGTLMAADVRAALARGETWVGRAFVVNDWHLSAYEPLRDGRGEVIGALYVGIPEGSFRALRARLNLIFALLLAGLVLGGGGVAAWLGASLSRPVKALEAGVRRVAAGDEAIPDLQVGGRDEIAALADEFNQMKQRLGARQEEILTLNRTLEEKVAARTAEVARKNEELLAAQAELARSERLAAIGTLAAGVAHEINNPLAIIRGNAELLPAGEESETIIRQSGRIERIVTNLLTFARGRHMRLSTFAPSPLLDNILQQITHQVPLGLYRLNCLHREPEQTLRADEDQLRQVFTNLFLNGLQVMPEGGGLTVESGLDADGEHFVVTVTDTGPGIADDEREQLFTPFFTTRRGGTGLGLAISYGIVRDHGGEIRVENAPGRGAAFTVLLPLET